MRCYANSTNLDEHLRLSHATEYGDDRRLPSEEERKGKVPYGRHKLQSVSALAEILASECFMSLEFSSSKTCLVNYLLTAD